MIRIVSLDCWHANEIIYQADGLTDDGLQVYVCYRRPYFSIAVALRPGEVPGPEADTYATDAHPDHDPSSIDLATLRAWTEGSFTWPDHIDGYANERGGAGP